MKPHFLFLLLIIASTAVAQTNTQVSTVYKAELLAEFLIAKCGLSTVSFPTLVYADTNNIVKIDLTVYLEKIKLLDTINYLLESGAASGDLLPGGVYDETLPVIISCGDNVLQAEYSHLFWNKKLLELDNLYFQINQNATGATGVVNQIAQQGYTNNSDIGAITQIEKLEGDLKISNNNIQNNFYISIGVTLTTSFTVYYLLKKKLKMQ